jgi:hypothetical protein
LYIVHILQNAGYAKRTLSRKNSHFHLLYIHFIDFAVPFSFNTIQPQKTDLCISLHLYFLLFTIVYRIFTIIMSLFHLDLMLNHTDSDANISYICRIQRFRTLKSDTFCKNNNYSNVKNSIYNNVEKCFSSIISQHSLMQPDTSTA